MNKNIKYCGKCIYRRKINGHTSTCDYFLLTKTRRPCPAGKGCTVKNTTGGRTRVNPVRGAV